MKKKIIFAIATSFFAVATLFNMNILQANSTGDASLEAIAIMAQAQTETDPKPKPDEPTGFDTVKVYARKGRTIVDCQGSGEAECKA